MIDKTIDQLALENEGLRHLLAEAEDTIRALRGGEVDAIVVGKTDGEQVYTLETTDRPYRLLVEQMHVGAASCTVDGIVLHGNRSFATLLGRAPETLAGKSIGDFLAAESRPVFEGMLRDALEGETRADIIVVRGDGTAVPAYVGVNPSREGALGLCLIVTDLTAQKHYEDLQRTQNALREADRRKNEFVAILAHELRNPLGPIRNAARIIKLRRPDDPDLKGPVEMIERQLEQLARLLDDLLDVSRIARGALEMRRERVVLTEVVDASAGAYSDELQSRGVSLHVSLPAGLTELMADRARLIQMLSNLIANAAKYTNSGGKVEIMATVDDVLRLSVKDDGIGIPPERLGDIFELFEQVDRSGEREGGLGIGLTLVRQIATLHGGSVEARSEGLGRGSEFIVTLPLVALDEVTLPAASVAGPRFAPRRILVVDDNRDAVESLGKLLEIAGNDVHRAVGGEAAISLAEQVQPEVVLLDLGMPKVSGYEVARRIREQPWGKATYLIAISGWGQDDARLRTQEAGFDAHLVKPVDPGVLDQILGALVSRPRESVAPLASEATA